MNYLCLKEQIERLRELDIDHKIHRVPIERLIERLRAERSLFSGPLDEFSTRQPVICLAILADESPNALLQRTISAWTLQSCPYTDCVVVPVTAKVSRDELQAWVSERFDSEQVRVAEPRSQLDLDELSKAKFITFSRPGDLLHPSTAKVVTTLNKIDSPTIVVWNEILVSPDFYSSSRALSSKILALLRRAELQQHTLNHLNYAGLSFAIRRTIARKYNGDLLQELIDNEGHLFLLWASRQRRFKWCTHPEYLATHLSTLPRAVRKDQITPYLTRYRAFFSQHEDNFDFVNSEQASQPYRLTPRRKAKSISVVIPFRDEPSVTCQCLKSISKQQVSGKLEVVLIDNQSSTSSVNKIESYAKTHKLRFSYVMEKYDKPFNHSAQCNLGADLGAGETIVFLNNDALLRDPLTLEEMAAWSLVTNVATVGVQITSKSGELVSSGVIGRHDLRDSYSAIAEESRDRLYAKVVRETFANTFALAALSRATYETLGALNATEYPNGYNDLEYCLRAASVGYIHMYLGHRRAFHTPGTSRKPTDERFQKMRLRAKYPEVLRTSLFQNQDDRDFRKRIADRLEKSTKSEIDIERRIETMFTRPARQRQ